MSIDQTTATAVSEAELRATVGTRADYYLAKWKGSKRASLNLAAFFMPGLWLPYRKMHRATATLFSLLLLESIAEDLIHSSGIMRAETPRRLQIAVTIAVCWVCGAFGNVWYRSHVKGMIAAAAQREPDDTQRLKLLAANGGTSMWLPLIWLLALGLAEAATAYVLKLTLGYQGRLG